MLLKDQAVRLLYILSNAGAWLFVLSCIACAPTETANIETKERPGPKTVQMSEKVEGHKELMRDLDETLGRSGIKPLRSHSLPEGELEVRIWKGWGMRGTKGIVIVKSPVGWKASLITIPISPKNSRPSVVVLPSPASGFDALWSKLIERQILILPDDSEVGVVEPFEDSELVIVDILNGDQQRTYSYNAPCYSDVAEGRNVKQIIEILSREFNEEWFACK